MPDGRTRVGLSSLYEEVMKGHDRNGDEKLSLVEIEAMVSSSLPRETDPERRQELQDWLLRDYSAQDTDGDGYLSLEELLKEPLATFECSDTNNDGTLSDAEIEAAQSRCASGRAYHVS